MRLCQGCGDCVEQCVGQCLVVRIRQWLAVAVRRCLCEPHSHGDALVGRQCFGDGERLIGSDRERVYGATATDPLVSMT